MLLLYTPLGLLQERSERKRSSVPKVDGASESSKRGLPEAGGWRVGSVGSVTENTTVHLELAETPEGRANTSDDIGGKPRITTR
jgi:hypothetical protein